MPDRYRDFDAFFAEATGEPVRFRLRGRDYELPPSLPAAIVLKAIRETADLGPDADLPPRIILDIIEQVLGPANLSQLLDDGASIIELGELLRWLMAIYSGGQEEAEAGPPAQIRRPAAQPSSPGGKKSRR